MFEKVFNFVMDLEGGYKLHKNPTEKTDTYAGIYRAAHPKWEGWIYIDEGENPPKDYVKLFYKEKFWDVFEVDNEVVKAMLFEYGVNAGTGKAVKLLQEVVGTKVDGDLGPGTKAAINKLTVDSLVDKYTIVKIDMYVDLANTNSRKYEIYLRGWMNRALKSHQWLKALTA